MKYVYGIDIGGTLVKCGLFRDTGELVTKWEIPTNRTDHASHLPQEITDTILKQMQEQGLTRDDVLGVGIGVPGPVTADGMVQECANLGWCDFQVSETMSRLLGMHVMAGNDANVACLGEMWQGGGKGYENILMITLGTGVGGGVVNGGKILAGSNGCGGEIGHLTVNPDEAAICGCGRCGHLEQYTSATGVVRLTKLRLNQDTQPSALRGVADITAKDVFECAKGGDPIALEVVEQFGKYLGMGLANVASVIDPQVFVIGGGVARAGQIILDVVEKYYNTFVMDSLKGKVFCFAQLGNDAGIFGCAAMLLQ